MPHITYEDEVYQEFLSFASHLKEIVSDFHIPLGNNISFLSALCSDSNRKYICQLLPVIGTMMFSFPLLNSILSDCEMQYNNETVTRYLRFMSCLSDFTEKYSEAVRVQAEYRKYISANTNSRYILSNRYKMINLPAELYEKLNELYMKYVSDRRIPENNIELVYSYVNQSSKSRQIMPFLLYQIFVKFTKPLQYDDFTFDKVALYSQKEYRVYENNGKNFKTYAKYVVLFIELLSVFESVCDRSLCNYFFERSSNLTEWAFRYNGASNHFDSSVYSLVASSNFSLFADSQSISGSGNTDICRDERIKANIRKYIEAEPDEVRNYIESYKVSRQKELAYIYTLALKTCRNLDDSSEFRCYQIQIEQLMRNDIDEQAKLRLYYFLDEHVEVSTKILL